MECGYLYFTDIGLTMQKHGWNETHSSLLPYDALHATTKKWLTSIVFYTTKQDFPKPNLNKRNQS